MYNTSEQTRYYDPEIGRFISPDSTKYLDPESIGGLNLYAYCLNNPVMNEDPSGNAWYNVLDWIGVGLVVAAATVLTLGSFGIAVGGAGLLGGVIHGAAVGALVGAGAGIALGAAGGMIYDAKTGNDFGTSIGAGIQAGFGIGAIAGVIIGGITGYFKFPQPGEPFNPNGFPGIKQPGVNPRTLNYGRSRFDRKKIINNFFETLKKGKIDKAVSVNRAGVINQGNHRLLMARIFKLTIEVVIGGMSE